MCSSLSMLASSPIETTSSSSFDAPTSVVDPGAAEAFCAARSEKLSIGFKLSILFAEEMGEGGEREGWGRKRIREKKRGSREIIKGTGRSLFIYVHIFRPKADDPVVELCPLISTELFGRLRRKGG